MILKLLLLCACFGHIKSGNEEQQSVDEIDTNDISYWNTLHDELKETNPQLQIDEVHCKLLINEVNTDSPFAAPSLFIELRRVYTSKSGPKPSNLLKDQFLIIIRAQPLAVVLYIDLTEQELHLRNEAEVFVIGDPGLPQLSDTGIALDHPAIRSIYKNPGHARLLDNGNDSPYAILLLNGKNKRRDIVWMRLAQDPTGNFLEQRFLVSELSRFRPLIRDMVVYGKRVHVSSCSVFDMLWPDEFEFLPDRSYILRDWDFRRMPDYSLNRCSSNNLPFQVRSFQYDKPSPGEHNPCNGVSFYVENIIDKIAPLHEVETQDIEMCSAEYPSVPAGRYLAINEQSLAEEREKMMPENCDPCDTGTTSQVYEAMDTSVNNAEIERLGGTPINPVLNVESQFDPQMIELAVPYLPDSASLLYRKEIQKWIRVKETQTPDRPISFTCSACLWMYGDKIVDLNLREQITTSEGYFNSDKIKNARKIRKHAESTTHKDAVELSFKLAKAASDTERQRLYKEYEERQQQDLIGTVRMVRTVFAEALAEVAFQFHPIIVNLQEVNGVYLGFHHYHDHAARTITKVISDTMHKTLLTHLVKEQLAFSLIVDATTSTRNIPYFITYFQLTEDEYPIVYLYRNINLEFGETAVKTFDAFWDKIVEDDALVPGFMDWFREKLTVFISDNAQVMVGENNSFLQLLKETLSRDVINMGCMAHKLSLVLKRALRDKKEPQLEFIKVFESNLNDLYIFYMSRGSKRLQHLVTIAEEMHIGVKRFKKNIEVRWAAGESAVIHAILYNMKAVRDDLLEIQIDDSFTPAAKEQAETIFSKLVDKPTCLLYHEFDDILEITKILSKKFQERAGLLVDHYRLILQAFEDYNQLAKSPGKSLSKFLSTCSCPNICSIPQCTLRQVEDCEHVTCEGVAITNNLVTDFILYNAREIIYQKLIEAFEKYFNFDLIKALVVFDNREFHNLDPDQEMGKFKYTCNFLKFEEVSCNQLGLYYFFLVGQLKANPTYSQNFQSDPSKFWPLVLQNTDNLLDIPQVLVDFLHMFMVLGDSSAEAERGFSVLNRLDSDARANLLPETIEALLRIKLNAMKPVYEIQAFLYAEEFVKKHHRVDDPKAGGREKKTKNSVYCSRSSRLF